MFDKNLLMNNEIHKDLHHQRTAKIPPNVCYLKIYNISLSYSFFKEQLINR